MQCRVTNEKKIQYDIDAVMDPKHKSIPTAKPAQNKVPLATDLCHRMVTASIQSSGPLPNPSTGTAGRVYRSSDNTYTVIPERSRSSRSRSSSRSSKKPRRCDTSSSTKVSVIDYALRSPLSPFSEEKSYEPIQSNRTCFTAKNEVMYFDTEKAPCETLCSGKSTLVDILEENSSQFRERRKREKTDKQAKPRYMS